MFNSKEIGIIHDSLLTILLIGEDHGEDTDTLDEIEGVLSKATEYMVEIRNIDISE